MRTIPTLLAAAALAVGSAILAAPQASATPCNMEQRLDPNLINYCMGTAPAAKSAPAPAPAAQPALQPAPP